MAGRHQSLTGGGGVPYDGASIQNQLWCVCMFVLCCVCVVCVVCVAFVCLFVCAFCVFCVFLPHTQHTHNTHTTQHTHTHNAHTHQVRASRVFWSYHYYYYYSRTTACQPARPPARPPLFNSSARRAAEFCGGCLVFCHIKCPISRVRASRVVGFANYPKFCRQIKSTGLSRVLVLRRRRRLLLLLLLLLAEYGQPASPPPPIQLVPQQSCWYYYYYLLLFIIILSSQQVPIIITLSSTGLSRVPAPYSIVPQSCGILCLVFCHIKCPISRVRASRVFLVLLADYGQPAPPAPYSIVPQSCGILWCLVFCHIKCPISRVRASRVGGISYICQNFAAKQGVRASRVFWGPYSIIINSAELCILPRRPGYYQSPISRVRPIHVGGISDVLCVCVCFCVFVSSTRGLVLGTWRFSDRPAQK